MIDPGAALAGCSAGGVLFLALARDRGAARPPSQLLLPAVAVGTVEELFWRGLVLGTLEPHIGAATTLLLSSAAFGLSHMPAQGRRGATVHVITGACFGAVFLGGGLAAALAAHATYNALAVSLRAAVPAAAVVEMTDVVKRFGPVEALAGVTLAIERGEVVALLGPNGAGKTTLVSLLLGLRRPDSGSIRIAAATPGSTTARRLVGATPQEMGFPPTLRVGEILNFALAHHPEQRGATGALLERFGLIDVARRQAGGLSGGQRRRLAVALAFASRPQLALLDEPSAGLDVESRLAVWSSIRDYAEGGGTVLLTTHQLDEAEQVAQRIVILDGGRVRADGTAADITAEGDRSLQDAYLLFTGAGG